MEKSRYWAAALAGTSLPIDREDVAARLGFEGVAANSLDVSSDRDFIIELAFVLALVAEHLSTWAEEWILWSTAEFNFLRLPQAFFTGSSMEPTGRAFDNIAETEFVIGLPQIALFDLRIVVYGLGQNLHVVEGAF